MGRFYNIKNFEFIFHRAKLDRLLHFLVAISLAYGADIVDRVYCFLTGTFIVSDSGG